MKIFWIQLDTVFLDKIQEQKILKQLNTLYQENQTVNNLLQKLNQLLLEVAGFDWSNKIKIEYLRVLFNKIFCERLVIIEEKEIYTDYCIQIKKLKDCFLELNRIQNNYLYRIYTNISNIENNIENFIDWIFTVNKINSSYIK